MTHVLCDQPGALDWTGRFYSRRSLFRAVASEQGPVVTLTVLSYEEGQKLWRFCWCFLRITLQTTKLSLDREEQSHKGCFRGILGVKDSHTRHEVRINKKQSLIMVKLSKVFLHCFLAMPYICFLMMVHYSDTKANLSKQRVRWFP